MHRKSDILLTNLIAYIRHSSGTRKSLIDIRVMGSSVEKGDSARQESFLYQCYNFGECGENVDMQENIVVYEKPTCSTCKQLNKVLTESGVDYHKVNYYIDRMTVEKLQDLIKKMDICPRDLLRTREEKYAELQLNSSSHTDQELIELMVQYPELIQRPIIEQGDKAVLGRPVERVIDFLQGK